MSPKKNTRKQNGGVFGLFNQFLKDGKQNQEGPNESSNHESHLTTGGKKKSKYSKTSKKSSKKPCGLKKMKKAVSKKMFKWF